MLEAGLSQVVAESNSEASHIWIDTDFMDPDDLDLYRWGIMGSLSGIILICL